MIVDDSIVVLENIQRRKGQGLGRRAAAVLGTRQVFFAVIATTATLISVFIPISFLPSTAGLLFREFGFVLAIAVIISSFVSLSLVPAMASRLPLDQTQGRPSSLAMLGQRVAAIYASSLRHVVRTPLLMAGVALLFVVISLFTYQWLNQELLPSEDRGFLYIYATGPDGAGLSYSDRQADKIEALLQPYVDSGEIAGVMTIVGRWDLNRVFVLAPLAPWESRQRSQQEIAAELRGPLSSIPGVRAGISSPNSLNLRGARGGLEVALLGNNYAELYEVARRMALALDTGYPGLDNPDISYQPTQPQLALR
jgi:Cation/multidrug efflux pump